MYDIRGKQDFIYKSSKIKEIVGGSYIIRDCFDDCLFPAAKDCSEKGIFSYRRKDLREDLDDFTVDNFEKRLQEGYIGEVVYDGGGNFFVLYKNHDIYKEVNRRFYHKLLEHTYSLRVLTTYISEVNFEDYPGDQKRLYEVHRRREQRESMISPVNTLPIVQTDYRTSLPLAELQYIGDGKDGRNEKVSLESKKKYEKYAQIKKSGKEDRQIQGTRLLDELITKKGEESLLAVIYIDGNNMGAQVENCLNKLKKDDGTEDKSYEASVKALRRFSADIQKNYIIDRIRDSPPSHGANDDVEPERIIYLRLVHRIVSSFHIGFHIAIVPAVGNRFRRRGQGTDAQRQGCRGAFQALETGTTDISHDIRMVPAGNQIPAIRRDAADMQALPPSGRIPSGHVDRVQFDPACRIQGKVGYIGIRPATAEETQGIQVIVLALVGNEQILDNMPFPIVIAIETVAFKRFTYHPRRTYRIPPDTIVATQVHIGNLLVIHACRGPALVHVPGQYPQIR